MTPQDLLEEYLYKRMTERPPRKHEETVTRWERDIFLYNRDETKRQEEAALRQGTERVTYENHRVAVETAVNIMKKTTPHDIAMCILTHRFFANYRKNAFAGKSGFVEDYSFILKKIAMLFDMHTTQIKGRNYKSKLMEFTEPTLVQVNHIMGIVSPITVPSSKFTLQEWASRYNAGAPESTSYMVAGLRLGA